MSILELESLPQTGQGTPRGVPAMLPRDSLRAAPRGCNGSLQVEQEHGIAKQAMEVEQADVPHRCTANAL